MKYLKRMAWAIPVAFLTLAALPSATASAAATQNAAGDVTSAAFQVAIADGLTGTGYNCLVSANNTAVPNIPASDTDTYITNHLVNADQKLAKPGEPCSNGGMVAGAGLTAGATEGAPSAGTAGLINAPGCTGGPYQYNWNINGHTTSSNMFMEWRGYGCYALEDPGYPICFPGAAAPGFSVEEVYCYNVANPAPYAVTSRNIFIVKFNVWLVNDQWTFWYWDNQFTNGAQQFGCHVGFC